MNLNRKIQPFTKDGIPAYNAKFNELITVANWLTGLRTVNGPVIRDSDQGPVIDLSQVTATQNQPWLADPNGVPASWQQWYLLAYDNNGMLNLALVYVWAASNQQPQPAIWMQDPAGNKAQWVQHNVCVNGQVVSKWFWGTP